MPGGKEQPDDKNSKDLLTGLYSRQIFIKMSEEYLSQNPDAGNSGGILRSGQFHQC